MLEEESPATGMKRRNARGGGTRDVIAGGASRRMAPRYIPWVEKVTFPVKAQPGDFLEPAPRSKTYDLVALVAGYPWSTLFVPV